MDRSDGLEAELNRRVLGQEEAISKVCRRLFVTRNRVQLYPERPLGVFMCAGPSGVGKTELAKALAQVYTGSEENLIRLDMSMYQSLASLLGRAGQPNPDNLDYLAPLTLALRRHPYGVLLLDEFEKADKEVWMAFLQAFDYGRMEDQQGNALHLGSHIVMMTCNTVVENEPEQDQKPIGFVQTDVARPLDKKAEDFRDATGLKFPTEFLGRLDELLVFRPLTDSVMTGFIEQKLKRLAQLSGKELVVEDEVRTLVRKRGFDEKYGARPLNLAIEDIIGTALARLKMTPEWESVKKVLVRLDDKNEPVAKGVV